MPVTFDATQGQTIVNATSATRALSPTSQINTGRKLIVGVVSSISGRVLSGVADNSTQAGAANTYTIDVTNNVDTGSFCCWIVSCEVTRNILTSDTITATWASSLSSTTGVMLATFLNVATAGAFDQGSSANSGAGTGTTYDSGFTATVAQGDCVVIGVGFVGSVLAAGITPGNDGHGGTMLELQDNGAGARTMHLEYLIETAVNTYKATGTWTGNQQWCASAAVYKGAAAANPVLPHPNPPFIYLRANK